MKTLKTHFAILLVLSIPLYAGCGDEDGTLDEGYTDIAVTEARMMIQGNPDLVVVDVSPHWLEERIPGALNLPVGDGTLDSRIPSLDKSKSYLVYCHADEPSRSGARKLVAAGFTNVFRLVGNFDAWKDAGYPTAMGPEPASKSDYVDVEPAKAKQLIDTMPDLQVIDVSPYWNEGHLPRARSYPVGDGSLDQAIPTLDKTKPYLVYCHADGPSISGAKKLVAAGFAPVYRLKGNYGAWKDAGYPIEK
jgi:rhodanese-related sulfurtransferase